jgi:PAS domain S-box-containing protein
MAELRTSLDATERRLQEANEKLQAQIAERQRVEQTSEKVQKYTESIGGTIREPLIVLTPDLRVISANHSFYETFHVTSKETEGKFIFDIGNHQWDIPALRELLEEIIPKNTHFNNFEVDHEFPTIGRKRMLLNARRIYRKGKGTDMILLALEDITDQKQSEEALIDSETRYRRLFEAPQDGILILDAETGQISDVNPFLAEMLGYSHDDFLGKKLWEIGPFKNIKASKATFLELQTRERGYFWLFTISSILGLLGPVAHWKHFLLAGEFGRKPYSAIAPAGLWMEEGRSGPRPRSLLPGDGQRSLHYLY